jgi:hypothetical protein
MLTELFLNAVSDSLVAEADPGNKFSTLYSYIPSEDQFVLLKSVALLSSAHIAEFVVFLQNGGKEGNST